MLRISHPPGNDRMPAHDCDPERWVESHGDCLYGYALARVRRPEVAEDLVQETLLAAVRQASRFAGRSSERSWLCGILKHKICDHFHKAGRETTFTDLESAQPDGEIHFDAGGHWAQGHAPANWPMEGESSLRRAEFRDALEAALAKLPPRIAQAFVLREIDNLPAREVCALLGVTETNLWVMLHRARLALRENLEAAYFLGDRPDRP